LEIILIPEPQLLRRIRRLLRAGDVLDIVAGATDESAHAFRPQGRNDTGRAPAPIKTREDRALNFERVEQFEKVLAERRLLVAP
jgi:hypothetical protein